MQLIKQRNWPHQVIGEGVAKSFLKKLMAFPSRIWNLKKYLQDKAIDVAICQSSCYLPLTAKLLGVPSIYTNDNEHAMGNIPSFLFATKIFVPENLSLQKVKKQGAKPTKTYQYPGIKEGVYLWVKGLRIINERKGADMASQAVYVRPEPQTAQYYSGKLNFLDDILLALAQTYNVVILVRDKAQFEHYSQMKFEKIQVPKEPIPFEKVALNCLMFIGAGGSMTREMSMIGIPTISVYQGELLDVDNFLIQEKYLVHQPDLDLQFVKQMLRDSSEMKKNRTELIEKGKEAYELLKSELINLKK
nr:DUF354 domain-containing protein [Cytophagales bacterium]